METTRNGFFRNLFVKKHSDSDDEQSAKQTLKDLCIYVVFLLVSTIIALSSREIGMFYFNHTIEKLFLDRTTFTQHEHELTYEEFVTVSDWWSFVQTTFIESIAHFEVKDTKNSLPIGGNMLLGLPRLRQIRVQNESCRVDEAFQNKFETCYGHYSKSKEDVGGFLGSKHFTQKEVSTNTVWGSINNYHGAGYIEMLTFDKEKNGVILSKLKDAIWIDRATRVILIEFALFNANVNLFCNVKLLAEIPATGGVRTSNHLQSLKYSPLFNESKFFVPFSSVIFFGLILYYTFEKVRDTISNGFTTSFGSVFKILDIVILLIAYLSIVYIIWHQIYLASILIKYAENANQYFSLDIICFWNLYFIDGMGICVFIVWLQIFKYIKFNKTMMQFSTTIQRCAKDLLGFSIMFSIVFISFAYLSVLLFGSVESDFCDFSTALLTLMRTVLGDFDYYKLEKANRILGPIFFLSFILIVFFILMNMFLAIINDTYSDVKSEITHGKVNQFEEYIKSLLSRLRNYILPAKKKDHDVENQKEEELKVITSSIISIPSVQTKNSAEQKSKTTKDILDSFFEIVTAEKDGEEDELTQRVTSLENKLETIIEHLDEILSRITKSAAKPSGRSL